MESKLLYLLAADFLLYLHALVVAFVIFGLLLIFIGKLLSWSWIRNPWFCLVHLLAISIVLIQSWLGLACPLTTWEMLLREKAGDVIYTGAFIAHWLEVILYYTAPKWVFTLCYTIFGLMVLAAWFWVRPRPFQK